MTERLNMLLPDHQLYDRTLAVVISKAEAESPSYACLCDDRYINGIVVVVGVNGTFPSPALPLHL